EEWEVEDLEAAKMAISAAKGGNPDDGEWNFSMTADQILVTEAWHLAERRGGKGRHVVCIQGFTLLDEEWEGPFPFAFMRWSEPVAGFFGVGLAEELIGIQNTINKLLLEIQRGQHLISGHWLVESGSKVTASQINNDLASIVKYAGVMPQYNAPAIIAPEVY